MTILIAEDDLTSRLMLSSVLKKHGHDVIETIDGQGALEQLLKPDGPKLAILDFMMPEMDGLEVVRRIRTIPTLIPPYLIMLTAKGEKSDIIAGLETGADDYLSKPFDVGELNARIDVGRRILDMQRQLVENREALAYQASHDALTGLLNRRAVLEKLDEQISLARYDSQPLCAAMMDIDHFKSINDTYGHQTGDDILKELSCFVQGFFPEHSHIGRFGGEEFLLILQVQKTNDCLEILENLRRKISSTGFETRSGTISLTISIGASFHYPGQSTDDLIGLSDSALYAAKQAGRNRVETK